MSLFACARLVQIVTSIEVSPPSILGMHPRAEGAETHVGPPHPRSVDRLMAKLNGEYTGLYSFSVAHT